MYQSFFGLVERPFNLTPDTHFIYPSPQHEGILKTLEYGINERKGFLLLTGEVGTGKTTLLRALLNRLPINVSTSLILNPLLSTEELLKSILKDFGCKTQAQTTHDMLDALNHFVLEKNRAGENAVVFIDEAQNLSFESLEMTRLLSNLETEREKLLQIVLVGQPELEEKLAEPRLRQLAQRIQIFCKLQPLDRTNLERYVHYRLERAGHRPMVEFEKSAFKELYRASGGVPRVVNSICENALLAAYSLDTRVISGNLVKKAAQEVPYHVHHS
ncbi:AAA family ATPase [bacterium]|nr:AAA family ATPase [bacterium]